MIAFEDLFPDLCRNPEDYKIHMAIGSIDKYAPRNALIKDEFKEWQEAQNNRNFERKYILSLIYFKRDRWLFGGVYKRLDVKTYSDKKRGRERWKYTTELVNNHVDLIGRLVFSFNKDFRASYLCLEKFYDRITVDSILADKINVDSFPGYENVLIEFDLLCEVIRNEEASWKTALSNLKGVYLITDRNNGKHYVGSAYGEEAFWNRWKKYTETGHGNNRELSKIIDQNGPEYALNFQFAILEIHSARTGDEVIIGREKYWKDILLSRQFGYNDN